MIPMISLVICITLVVGVFALHRKRQANEQRTDAKQCLEEIGALKSLLLLIQRHRGLSSGYLNGDQSLNEAICGTANKINDCWQHLHRSHAHLIQDSLFEGVQEHWQRLQSKWQDQEIENNIEQHNRLILNLLYLIENEAEHSSLLVRIGRSQGSDVIWKELLETIEAIGQTRAIGTSIVASGQSSAVDRIRLKFLLDKMSQHLDELEQSFASSENNDKQQHLSFVTKAKQQARVLSQYVEANLTHQGPTNQATSDNRGRYSSEHFFGLASAAIEPLDQLFERALHQLSVGLE